MLALPAAVQAQFNYEIENGTITITGYTGPGGFVIIPYQIPNTKTGLVVTAIGDFAFSGCSNVTSVSMYSGVATIGVGAFYHCQNLTNVTVPNVRAMIWDEAFAYSGLTSFTIPAWAGAIAPYTFGECSNLTSVTIPDGLASIGGQAFYDCKSLASVTIPSSVSDIAPEAFWGCASLTNITIPCSVTEIDRGAFGDCASLTAIMVDAQNANYSSRNGVLFDTNQTTLVEYPSGLLNSGYVVPDSVTNIADEAFAACANLTSVYFQSNAPSLGGSDVFDYDENLTVYRLPGTTSWDTTFGGRPTALWLPEVLTNDSSFGLRTNQFGFNITWSSGLTVVVDACTNLANPGWLPLQTNNFTGGSFYFSDPQWTNYPGRFYRLRSP